MGLHLINGSFHITAWLYSRGKWDNQIEGVRGQSRVGIGVGGGRWTVGVEADVVNTVLQITRPVANGTTARRRTV